MYYLANNGLSFFMHFSIRGVLNRMLDKDAMRVRHTQGVCLSRGRGHELRRSDGYRWCSLNLKPYRVMQTARGTRASVGQRLDDKVIVLVNFFTQGRGRWLRKCWLGVSRQRDPG